MDNQFLKTEEDVILTDMNKNNFKKVLFLLFLNFMLCLPHIENNISRVLIFAHSEKRISRVLIFARTSCAKIMGLIFEHLFCAKISVTRNLGIVRYRVRKENVQAATIFVWNKISAKYIFLFVCFYFYFYVNFWHFIRYMSASFDYCLNNHFKTSITSNSL